MWNNLKTYCARAKKQNNKKKRKAESQLSLSSLITWIEKHLVKQDIFTHSDRSLTFIAVTKF